MEEKWTDIVLPQDYSGIYQISNFGKIRSMDRYKKSSYGSSSKLKGILRNPIKYKKNGYLSIILSNGINRKQYLMHRLVALNFIPNPERKKCVNHKDGIRDNNLVSNLEWVSHFENYTHSANVLKTNISSIMVDQCDINGNIIKIFDSISQVEKFTGFNKANIHKAIKNGGIRYGYKWNTHVSNRILSKIALPI